MNKLDFPKLITIGSNTLDILIQIDDILRFELFDKEIIKKYTAIEYSRKLNVKNVRIGEVVKNVLVNALYAKLNIVVLVVLIMDFIVLNVQNLLYVISVVKKN